MTTQGKLSNYLLICDAKVQRGTMTRESLHATKIHSFFWYEGINQQSSWTLQPYMRITNLAD